MYFLPSWFQRPLLGVWLAWGKVMSPLDAPSASASHYWRRRSIRTGSRLSLVKRLWQLNLAHSRFLELCVLYRSPRGLQLLDFLQEQKGLARPLFRSWPLGAPSCKEALLDLLLTLPSDLYLWVDCSPLSPTLGDIKSVQEMWGLDWSIKQYLGSIRIEDCADQDPQSPTGWIFIRVTGMFSKYKYE